MLGTILLIILILILIGALPTWPHSSGWGYYPSGGVGPDPDHRRRLAPVRPKSDAPQ